MRDDRDKAEEGSQKGRKEQGAEKEGEEEDRGRRRKEEDNEGGTHKEKGRTFQQFSHLADCPYCVQVSAVVSKHSILESFCKPRKVQQ